MRPSRYAFPAALLCAAGLSIGLCFCVITSFAVPADPVRLLLACFLAAALFSAVFLLKKSWIWLLVVLLLAGRADICSARSCGRACLRSCMPSAATTPMRSPACRLSA